MKITFDDTTKRTILEILGKKVMPDGKVVEKKSPYLPVKTFEGEELHYEDFGGIQKGSEVFIKRDLISLIRLSKRQ